MFAFDLVEPLLHDAGYYSTYLQAKDWFSEWGFWAIFLAGFSPIPYKVFTITAGVISMALMPFVLASMIGRGARFFLVAALMFWGGERMEAGIKQYVERIGWITVVLLVGVIVVAKF